MKSEPEAFSLDDLRLKKVSGWDGVRNYQARNFMRAMRKGDQALFYHSNAAPSAIVGRMEIVREAYPDPTQFDPKSDHFEPASTRENPRWDQVDVKFLEVFPTPLSLEQIRQIPQLQTMMLVTRSRLSVQPVEPEAWQFILRQVGAR